MEIELGGAVAALRDELLEAAAQGANREVVFEVGPIEMEFQVELRRDVRVKSGFRAWVLSADADAGVARGRAHRVSFSLTPRGVSGGGPLLISAREDDAIVQRPDNDPELRAR
ncbi:trypco2 family protein [Streptomyces sp. I05A-00742]|uniref:trypco2 family protein n=1 Tax=Streptomyces sp. I05A-00742 TaxID=2732853 RepID=UPI0014897BB3|nr:trypco2 family protein [Streptomyces sp. I05A-00742]